MVIIAAAPLRKKWLFKKAGACRLALTEHTGTVLPVIVLVCTPVLPVLLCFRTFEWYIHGIFVCIPVCAAWMMTQELILNGKSGVYGQLLVANGRILPIRNIASLSEVTAGTEPAAAAESAETGSNSAPAADTGDMPEPDVPFLKIITRKNHTIVITFANSEERDAAAHLLAESIGQARTC